MIVIEPNVEGSAAHGELLNYDDIRAMTKSDICLILMQHRLLAQPVIKSFLFGVHFVIQTFHVPFKSPAIAPASDSFQRSFSKLFDTKTRWIPKQIWKGKLQINLNIVIAAHPTYICINNNNQLRLCISDYQQLVMFVSLWPYLFSVLCFSSFQMWFVVFA